MSEELQIETSQVVLKTVQVEDAADIYAYVQNPNVLRHTSGTTPKEFAETQVFVRRLAEKPKGAYAWAIRKKEDPAVIGVVEFGTGEGGTTGSIDYALSEEFWNRGIMTETVRAVLDWAFRSRLSLERVTASAVTVNRGSTRVMEKCGMELQRAIKEKWDKFAQPVDLSVYSISRKRWESSQQ